LPETWYRFYYLHPSVFTCGLAARPSGKTALQQPDANTLTRVLSYYNI
jgi:hypothetical protein